MARTLTAMPAKGVKAVRRKITLAIDQITGPMAQKALTVALIVGGSAADVLTPRDTSFLVNSRYREVKATTYGWSGRYGYAASYAAAVHDMPGDNVGKNTLRDPNNPGRGVMWQPDAEPEFLAKGFEQSKAAITDAVMRAMRI
jgi:hypothetical protein